MTMIFVILVVLASVVLALIVLVQNPKGGGLAGSIAGFNTQFMGVKQTTDVLEKGTWVMAIAIALLCLFSAFFIPEGKATRAESINARPSAGSTAPNSGSPLQNTAPAQG